MEIQNWQQVRELFDLLADKGQAEREAALSSASLTVRAELAWMLANHAAAQGSTGVLDGTALTNPSLIEWLREARNFSEGDVLLSRFKVQRLLGRGGMGEVYECWDRESATAVAVKTVLFELRHDEAMRSRFIGEVQKSRQVAHRNVCRVHEIFTAFMADGTELPFFSMELLPGVTLREYVKQHGSLSVDRALDLAQGICGGLAEAHRSGVIHRDLKCSNIMLPPSGKTSEAKIMDFGLARDLPSHGDTLVTGIGAAFSGTLQYMAPELLEGRRAAVASDIYALGIVLYYAVTGRYPFEAEADIVSAAMRLKHPPVSPRKWAPALPRAWERAILACLEPEPGARPTGATDVALLLSGDAAAQRRVAWRRASQQLRRRKFLGAGLLLVTGGAAGALLKGVGAPPFADKPARVLIAAFRTPPPARQVARTARSLLRAALFNIPNLRPLKPAEVSGAMQRLGLGSAELQGETALRVALEVKADLVIEGSIEQTVAGYRMVAKAIRMPGRADAGAFDAQFSNAAAVQTAVGVLCRKLQIALAGPSKADLSGLSEAVAGLTTESSSAMEEFAAGLDFFLHGETNNALPHLQRATEFDPQFALAWIFESKISGTQRKDERAFHASRQAYELRSGLTRRYQLEAEALYRFWTGDPHRSLDLQKQLVAEFPSESHTQRQIAQSYGVLELPREGVPHGRLAVELDPQSGNNYMVLAATLAQAEDLEGADRVLQTARSVRASNPEALLMGEATLAGHRGEAERGFDLLHQLETKPGWEMQARMLLTHFRLWFGHLSEARSHLESSTYLAATQLYAGNEDHFRYWLGQLHWLYGDSGAASSHAAALASREKQPFRWFAFRAAAQLAWLSGDVGSLREAGGKLRLLAAEFPSRQAAALSAEVAAYEQWLANRRPDAIAQLRRAHDLMGDVAMTWALAEMNCRSGGDLYALPLYESVIERKGAAMRFDGQIPWVVSLAQAARCQRRLGNAPAAKSLYERFLSHWGANTDVELVADVMRENTKIERRG